MAGRGGGRGEGGGEGGAETGGARLEQLKTVLDVVLDGLRHLRREHFVLHQPQVLCVCVCVRVRERERVCVYVNLRSKPRFYSFFLGC